MFFSELFNNFAYTISQLLHTKCCITISFSEDMKIYTKTGDKGMTSLVGGERVSKTDARLEAYGTVDELNSALGLLLTYLESDEDCEVVGRVQNDLFVVGGYLATNQDSTKLRSQSIVSDEMVNLLEASIDSIESILPPLKAFILPGGSRGAAVCHVCRTVCRRAERRIVDLNNQLREQGKSEIEANVMQYMNRLSDFLFVLARKINIIANNDEIIWKNSCK